MHSACGKKVPGAVGDAHDNGAAATCYFFCPSERRAISGGLIKALDAGIYKSAKRETKEVAQHFITARAARGRNLVTLSW